MVENLTPEQVSKRANDAIDRFRRENNLDPSKKIFAVLGQYKDMRDAFSQKHGWIENPIENFENPTDYRCHAFHFLYTTKSKDAFKFQTASWQQLNHFEGTKTLTTKVGLTHSMKNLVWHHDMDINEVFPQSYDLTDFNSEEFKDFLSELRFGQMVATLKSTLHMNT